MSDQTYNGWTNYATWGVALVLDNDPGTYDHVHILANDAREEAASSSQVAEGIWTVEQAGKYGLASVLEDFVQELIGLGGEEYGLPELSMMAQQVIQAGLADVNWDEIAGHYMEEN